jgi:hypothetical protein
MLIVVDRFSKFVILIPTRKDITTKQMVHLMMKHVFAYTDFPPEIMSGCRQNMARIQIGTDLRNSTPNVYSKSSHNSRTS